MTEITGNEEFERDWAWFAIDGNGVVAQFATAGEMRLPRSVREDREAVLTLTDFFESRSPDRKCETRQDLKSHVGPTWDSVTCAGYAQVFETIAKTGLLAFDASLYSKSKYYFLVSFPLVPINLGELPPHIQELLRRTRVDIDLLKVDCVTEEQTVTW